MVVGGGNLLVIGGRKLINPDGADTIALSDAAPFDINISWCRCGLKKTTKKKTEEKSGKRLHVDSA